MSASPDERTLNPRSDFNLIFFKEIMGKPERTECLPCKAKGIRMVLSLFFFLPDTAVVELVRAVTINTVIATRGVQSS